MSEKQVIDAKIDAAARRRKLQRGWQNMWLGLLIGVCLWLASLSVYKLAPVPQTTLLWAGVIGLALPLAGLLFGLAKRFAGSDTARWLDREIGLKERLSTAVEMSDISAKNSAWSALVISDAAKAAGKIEPGKLLPLRLPKVCHWTLLVLAACVGLGFVPEHRSQAHLDQQRDSAIIEDVGQNLTELTKQQLLSPPHFEPTKDALESVQELGREFKRGKLVRDEALAKLSSLADRLRDQSSKLGQARTLNKMQQAAWTPPAAGRLTKAEMQRQLDELKKSLGDAKEAMPEHFDALKSKMDDVKDAAAGLPEASSPEGQQARLELAQSMADLARMAEQMGLEMPNIDEALHALESSDIDQFLKNMDFIGEDLQKMADLAKARQNLQMQMQMAEIGKTLGEQLGKGQVPAAIESLQKMMEELTSAQLTPAQLEKMIQELQEALGPAEDFGECSKCLSDAKGKAKAGDKVGASQSLAEASEELKKVLQQLDLENMMAALQNLERAQLAVGNYQSFGSSQKPGVGPTSKPGGGVGTWGDDSYQLTPEALAQRWDNSGFSRPDMDARGNTDRGAGNVPDDMVSTRIKGKINPKGSMPSITLRGMSIKGSSKVQFQEAMTAAQSDARNALNQDKVPRAYRDSVRDYFDDLKE